MSEQTIAAAPKFSTLDIYFTAFLTSEKGFQETTEVTDKGKVMFVFPLSWPEAKAFLDEFEDPAGTCNRKNYVWEIKRLRGVMNARRREI